MSELNVFDYQQIKNFSAKQISDFIISKVMNEGFDSVPIFQFLHFHALILKNLKDDKNFKDVIEKDFLRYCTKNGEFTTINSFKCKVYDKVIHENFSVLNNVDYDDICNDIALLELEKKKYEEKFRAEKNINVYPIKRTTVIEISSKRA
jgi:hypothetical protein